MQTDRRINRPRFLQVSGKPDFLEPGTEARRFFPWPFGELSPSQKEAHLQQLQALRTGQVRRIPTVFGELDEAQP
jgi:hypothetical protein